jgi:hypothetical protein
MERRLSQGAERYGERGRNRSYNLLIRSSYLELPPRSLLFCRVNVLKIYVFQGPSHPAVSAPLGYSLANGAPWVRPCRVHTATRRMVQGVPATMSSLNPPPWRGHSDCSSHMREVMNAAAHDCGNTWGYPGG